MWDLIKVFSRQRKALSAVTVGTEPPCQRCKHSWRCPKKRVQRNEPSQRHHFGPDFLYAADSRQLFTPAPIIYTLSSMSVCVGGSIPFASLLAPGSAPRSRGVPNLLHVQAAAQQISLCLQFPIPHESEHLVWRARFQLTCWYYVRAYYLSSWLKIKLGWKNLHKLHCQLK